ncbi:uncharacterized protein LOC124151758 isoform X1 [Haliotis rufescens]|uniref:uncharacterized protein LOC124151758 isoform X1 n=1 Tax=Haliotis rufescens TaxID=6454 RepID=UPI00201E9596|nr:uncharacterized protein LOC124151758 isoform X1 [Haliotis rufescens]
MPVTRRLTVSECEGFDSEVEECFSRTEPTEFHDSVPKYVTIKPKPVARHLTVSGCEGFDSEVAECFSRTEPTEFHNLVPKHVTIKPRPIRPEPPFQWDCSKKDKQLGKELDLHVQLTAVLVDVDILRADLRDARLRSQCLKLKNQHLQRQVRQLSGEKVSLGEQVDRLVKERDMLRAERLRVHSGEGEGVGLVQRSGATQTTCFDHIVQSKNDMPREQGNRSTRHHELSQSSLSSKKHMSSSTTNLIETCIQKQNVQKSKSFFGRFTKLFRRNKC